MNSDSPYLSNGCPLKSVGSHTLPTDFNGQPLLRYGESEFTQYTVGNFSSRAFKRCIGEIVIRRQRKVIVENRVKNSRAPCVCQIEGFRPWLASSISDGGRPLENKQDNMMDFDLDDPARCPGPSVIDAIEFPENRGKPKFRNNGFWAPFNGIVESRFA